MAQKDFFPCVKKNASFFTLESIKNCTFSLWNKNETVFHSHKNYLEIFILTKGKNKHFLNGTISDLTIHDAVFIPHNTPHQLLPSPNTRSCTINITMNCEQAAILCRTLYNVELENLCAKVIHLTPKQMDLVNNFSEQILSANDSEQDALNPSFFSYMISLFLPTEIETSGNLPPSLKLFLDKLNNINLETVNISELYSESHYSQSALSIQFKKHLGMTLVQYVTRLKLEYAANLLKKTDYSTQHIALKIGFQNLSHFNRLFKKHYNLPPAQYRKLFQNPPFESQ